MTQLDDQIADRIIEVMNRLLRADKATVIAMLATRYRCNKAFADDPTVQVAGYGGDAPTVSMLGVLNGLAGILPEGSKRPGWGRVAAVFEVACPVHGEGLEVNDGARVGVPCRSDGCAAVLELGSLVRFERTVKAQDTPQVIVARANVKFSCDEANSLDGVTASFGLPAGYDRLTTSIHIGCMRPIFRDTDGSRVRTADDCKCDDKDQA